MESDDPDDATAYVRLKEIHCLQDGRADYLLDYGFPMDDVEPGDNF